MKAKGGVLIFMAVCLQYLECVPKSIEGIDIWGGREKACCNSRRIWHSFSLLLLSCIILLLPGVVVVVRVVIQ